MSNKHPMGYTTDPKDKDFRGMMEAVPTGQHKGHFLSFYNKHKKEEWRTALEIRASGRKNSGHDTIKDNIRLEYTHTDAKKNPIFDTVVWDFESKSPFESNYFDVIFSSQTLEHTKKPWIVCEEIVRVAKPGGIVYVRVPFSWRYHPAPIDYWRFSPECLINLLSGIEVIEAGFDNKMRRNNIRGLWPNKKDAVPVDKLGGFIENWQSYFVGTKR